VAIAISSSSRVIALSPRSPPGRLEGDSFPRRSGARKLACRSSVHPPASPSPFTAPLWLAGVSLASGRLKLASGFPQGQCQAGLGRLIPVQRNEGRGKYPGPRYRPPLGLQFAIGGNGAGLPQASVGRPHGRVRHLKTVNDALFANLVRGQAGKRDHTQRDRAGEHQPGQRRAGEDDIAATARNALPITNRMPSANRELSFMTSTSLAPLCCGASRVHTGGSRRSFS